MLTVPVDVAWDIMMDVFVIAEIAPWCCRGNDDGCVCEGDSPLVLQGK